MDNDVFYARWIKLQLQPEIIIATTFLFRFSFKELGGGGYDSSPNTPLLSA